MCRYRSGFPIGGRRGYRAATGHHASLILPAGTNEEEAEAEAVERHARLPPGRTLMILPDDVGGTGRRPPLPHASRFAGPCSINALSPRRYTMSPEREGPDEPRP